MDATSKTPAGGPALRDYARETELACQLYGTTPADSTSARAGYHGIHRPHEPPPPRAPLTVAHDLNAAAECLAGMAEDFAAGVFDDVTLSSADRLLVGAGRLIVELRQQREARQ